MLYLCKTTSSADGAHLDVIGMDFWATKTFFDVRVFIPFVKSHIKSTLPQCYHQAELVKTREVEQFHFCLELFQLLEVLVVWLLLSINDWLHSLLTTKIHSKSLFWLCCKPSFALSFCVFVGHTCPTTGHPWRPYSYQPHMLTQPHLDLLMRPFQNLCIRSVKSFQNYLFINAEIVCACILKISSSIRYKLSFTFVCVCCVCV